MAYKSKKKNQKHIRQLRKKDDAFKRIMKDKRRSMKRNTQGPIFLTDKIT